MSELFDLIAGTSTGSLLTTSLILPNGNKNGTRNKFFADDAIDIYQNKASVVFTKYQITNWSRFWGTIIFSVIGGLLGIFIGWRMYYNKEHEDTMKAFKQYVKQRKATAKHHQQEHTELENTLALNVQKHLHDVYHGE